MTRLQAKRSELAIPASGAAPTTHGVTYDGAFYSLDAQAGRPAVFIIVGRLPAAVAAKALAPFRSRCEAFAALGADILALVDLQSPHGREIAAFGAPLRVVFSQPEVFRSWGFDGDEPKLAVLDRAGRVLATPAPDDPRLVEFALDAVAALPASASRHEPAPAPVLALPRLFSPAFCRELIGHFEASAHALGGMASLGADGRALHKIDQSKKHRYDCVLGASNPYLNRVMASLVARCLPEMKKAFQAEVRHTDRVLIARYDDTGGYFRRHRDNTAPAVAFRQFALSVNLNDDYEGGELQFPEYNAYRYRPSAGSGLAFSCSLLHEAAPVTRGRRYVLLTFLHDGAAQTRWLESARQPAA